jgi:DHA3 family multidrug efflux protein-like MFS transporter
VQVFNAVLANSLAASVTNHFVWFAVTFWVYLQTRSVLATSLMAGIYLGTVAVTGFFLGSLVDRYPKKHAMLASSAASLALYGLGAALYAAVPPQEFTRAGSPALWVFVILTLFGAIAGNLRAIALSALVTVLIPEGRRDRANGLVGSATGVAFVASSVFSGVVIGYLGAGWMLALAIGSTLLTLAHLATVAIPAAPAPDRRTEAARFDLRGTIAAVRAVPGLSGLILFATFNNLLGGVFMALMDAYGLLLVSVQVWGFMWGVLSLGFILGGLVVARRGLGPSPLRTLFLCNLVMWGLTMGSVARSSIVLLAVGMFILLCLQPAAEAAEQTILQKVIPPEQQGRVFGFALSVEQAASPLTALLMGPLAEYLFVPFMTDGAGVAWLGPWFGAGKDRGLALLFAVTSLLGLAVTGLGMRSRSYRLLSQAYGADSGEAAARRGEVVAPTPAAQES